MKYLLGILFLTTTLFATAQKETFDMVSCTPPKGWKKDVNPGAMTYSITDSKKNNWCIITIVKSMESKGSIDADFNSDWQTLMVKGYGVKDAPQSDKTEEADGWKIKAGGGSFTFNNATAIGMLTTMSGYNRCVSIVAATNSQDYMPDIESLLNSVDLKKTVTNNTVPVISKPNPVKTDISTAFAFTTTNFDDGWVSTSKENWAEVTKGNCKLLVHYPNKNADAYNSVLKEEDYNAWNILVSPRYTNLKNFEWKSIQSYESITFVQGDATDKASGKNVHIVLFKKHYTKGNGRYLEIVTTSKADYENEFGAYHNDEFGWDKVANMQFRNKFALAPNDLIGKWSANDYASLTYYYVNTGGTAGTTATSTADEFTFLPGNNYQSQHSGASGMVGNMKFSSQAYKGKSTVTNWNISLTNRFQGATEKYDCYFEAIKGGRILLMTDRLGTTFSLVRK